MVLLENDAPKVLLVDDKPENIAILIDMLEPVNLELFVALSAKEVYEHIKIYDFDLILLDIIMPEISGYEVCQKLKSDSRYKDIPLIFISALSGVEDKIKGFSYGVDDYITKPLLEKELIARVKLHLQKGMLLKSLKQLLRKSYHELYNPLSIINTSLEMQNIKHGTSKYIDAITVASRTLQVVYDDLYYSLSSDVGKADLLVIELKEFIQKRIDYFYYFKNSKNITIEFKSMNNCKVQMREADLQRVVDNTLSNAIKYAKYGSIVTIEVIDSDNNAVFKSQNYGSEIKNNKKIFTKGYRENYDQVGMGIGLEIVASICHTYNISTEVISENGSTSFKYSIPKNNKLRLI
ncbi:MAG: hybrid sensor histidine kinase/response regulator [Campylobacterota bacterium]|nr:hybrid sensor histidine kinase/response regulator [Campylobacterota bacterium]